MVSNNKSDATYHPATPVVVLDQPQRETRPLGAGVSLTLIGHAALAYGIPNGIFPVLAAVVLTVGILVTGWGIARVGR